MAKLPRFKEKVFGSCPPSMSISEYEQSMKSNERKNAFKRSINNLLDKIDPIEEDLEK